MNKYKQRHRATLLILVILILCVVSPFLLQISLHQSSHQKARSSDNYTYPLQELTKLCKKQDRSQLIESLKKIDEYSSYLNKQEFDSFSIDTKQQYQGIGVSLISNSKEIVVTDVFNNSPAHIAGIKKNDIITKIDHYNVENWEFTKVINLLRGRKNSHVNIEITRSNKLIHFNLKRNEIEVPSIEDVTLTENGILYLQIVQFGEKTAREFLKAISPHMMTPIKGLVIDLRNNTGGIFQSSLDLLDAFYEKGDTMLMTKAPKSKWYKKRKARHKAPLSDLKTVILVNRNTASASEVLAGSLQATGKAILIGEKTLGKGSIQTVYSLGDGDAFKKTTSYYYLPDGSSIHKKGIMPDIQIATNSQDYKHYLLREQSNVAPFNTPNDNYWNTAVSYILSR